MTKRILMVDDDPEVLKLYALFFELGGYEVLRALDADRALAHLETTIPDLFILDIMMPGMDGIELCEHLRARPETADTPVLMLSARGDDDTIRRAYDVGASDYLVKPIEPIDLENKVAELVTQAAAA